MFNVVSFVIALLASAILPTILLSLALIPWRRLPEEPWTERAREMHSISQGVGSLMIALPLCAFALQQLFFPEVSIFAIVGGTVVGSAFSTWATDTAIFPSLGFKQWIRLSAIVATLRLSWLLLVLFFVFTMPNQWSVEQIGWALGFLVLAGALSAGVLVKIFIATGLYQRAPERITNLVNECSTEAGVTVKAIWIFTSPAAFAAALVVQKALLFTSTTIEEHDDDEFRAICRHELAHLTEGRWAIVMRVAQTPVSLLPFVFAPTFYVSMGLAGLFVSALLWLLILKGANKFSLRFEKRADAAARQDGDSSAYANALERLHRRNLAPAVLGPKVPRTHPDLYHRMLAAGVTPAYERPLPPKDGHWVKVCASLVGGAAGGALVLQFLKVF